ncbi:DNA cytosine methyltransferase [Pseudocolwellia sp. AS88]|uniref:DNA cytosine methyltransferase n=1 Tax=Pseudocolwellia sp. AS88 TaxID=3063958 RepID=UPI0026F19AF2|nr:DNA cytosine methyltransferase [Pseudocolwellia sp. AS88]MDO7085525.1 DNA cytosine methyltransferase [Pseudocolwellia sp. AS88]
MSLHLESLSLKTTSKGARVWLNNASSKNCGFVTGANYTVNYFESYVDVILEEEGKRVVVEGNIMDIQNNRLAKVFSDTDRVHVEYQYGRVRIKPYYHDEKIKRRKVSLIERVSKNSPIRIGELFAGTGWLGKKVAEGLLIAGISSSLAFANEHDRHGADLINNFQETTQISNAVIVQDDLFNMDKSLVPELDIMVMGYPCVGFTGQQSVKRSMDIEHEAAGMLFVPVLDVLNRANPSVIILENSDKMIDSTTDHIMTTVLSKAGYKFSHTILSGTEYGDFEQRKRLAKVYYSENLAELDLSLLVPTKEKVRTFSEVLEPISDDSAQWRDLSYLAKKNDETKHGHKFIVSKPEDTRLPAFSASYGKTQADSALIEHPTNPALHRICSAGEHCNVRRITGNLKAAIVSIADGTHHLQKGRTNATKSHSLLGNSITPTPWKRLGEFLGNWINAQTSITKVKKSFAETLFV